jgi:hypothetical protein
MEPQTKTCSCCKKILPLEDFHKNKNQKDGYHHYCKSCGKQESHERHAKNMESEEYRKKQVQKSKNWVKANRSKVNAYARKRTKKPEIREKIRNAWNKRYHTDIQFKLADRFRKRFKKVMKEKSKSEKTLSYLGCSTEKFKEHMESQFTEGMNWNNHGFTGWHIDHIIPCSSFDLTKEEDIRKCFHYTNLQPLWGTQNMQKGSKILNQPF